MEKTTLNVQELASALGISRRIPEYDIIPTVPEDCSLRIKSGVAPGVRNFVGYFTDADDEMFSFAILCNTIGDFQSSRI